MGDSHPINESPCPLRLPQNEMAMSAAAGSLGQTAAASPGGRAERIAEVVKRAAFGSRS